ncbi:MAG: RDD family protein [Dermatophilaceae bacterium]
MSEPAISTLGVTEDDLVTGEAVALDLPPASVGLRILSGWLDYVIVMALLVSSSLATVSLVQALDEALQTAVVLLVSVTCLVGYPVAVETLSRGRSVGKLAAGLRTVRDDAGPVTFRHALARGLLWVVEVYLLWGIPAVISCVVTSRSKCLGDIAAGTYVVRDRVRASLPPPVPMPPHLAGWVRSADLGALPDGLAMTVRSFLPAAFTMTPAVRERMGRQLLDEVMCYVAPPPPAGSHPEYVLAAVIADRRRRDTARLVRDAALRDRLIPPDPLAAPVRPAYPGGDPSAAPPPPQLR